MFLNGILMTFLLSTSLTKQLNTASPFSNKLKYRFQTDFYNPNIRKFSNQIIGIDKKLVVNLAFLSHNMIFAAKPYYLKFLPQQKTQSSHPKKSET